MLRFPSLAILPEFVGGRCRPHRHGNRFGGEPLRGAVPGRVHHHDLLGGVSFGPPEEARFLSENVAATARASMSGWRMTTS
jgi:hypothetical protein